MSAAKTLGEQQERQVARRRLLARLVQRDDVVELFRALRSRRGDLGLRLARSTLQEWAADEAAQEATVAALRPAIDEATTEERSQIAGLLRSLELDACEMAWLDMELRAASQIWLTKQDRAEGTGDADLITLLSEAQLSAHMRLGFAESNLYAALGVDPPPSQPPAIGVVPQWLADRARVLMEEMIGTGIIPAEKVNGLRDLFEERLPVEDTWAQGLLEIVEIDVGPRLTTAIDRWPQMASLRRGTDATVAHAAVNRWAHLAHALVDASSSADLPRGRQPDKRRGTIERDVDLFYRARVGKETHRALARAEFGDPSRTGEIRDRITLAELLLTQGDSEAA